MILFGSLFKLMHWPGAGILITIGFVLFSLWILPAMLINNYKGANFKDKKWVYITAFLAVMIDFIGALFKIQHWTGASLFLLIGISIPFVVFLPVYIYHYNKDKNASSSNFLAVILLLIYIAVFSVFLALSVSKNIIDNLVFTGDNLNKSNIYISNYLNDFRNENIDNEKLLDIEKKKEEVLKIIQESKQAMLDISEEDEMKVDNIDLYNLKMKDNIYLSYDVMLESDDGKSRAEVLKNAIDDYRNSCLELLNHNSKKKDMLMQLLSTTENEPLLNSEGRDISWEERYFRSIQFISLYNKLLMIESNVEIAELLVYNSFE